MVRVWWEKKKTKMMEEEERLKSERGKIDKEEEEGKKGR